MEVVEAVMEEAEAAEVTVGHSEEEATVEVE
jgi:hypothetical protein